MKIVLLSTTIISLFAAVAQAQNENVAWQTPANISGASDVSLQGTYFGSWAPGDVSANTLPVTGVHFQAYSDLPGLSVGGFGNGYNDYNNPSTGNNNYNELLQYASYDGSGNGSGDTLTWSDIPGHTYLIEVWANDGRGNGRSETITGGTNTSASLVFGNAPGTYIMGTYVADSSGSETITFSGAGSANGDYPQINLLLIRDITQGSVTWQTPASISGDSDVSTQGTYFGSWAPYDGSAGSEPVNGVTFQGNSDLPGFNNTGYNSGYNAYPASPNGSANYNALLAYGAYDSPGQAYATFSWGGMTPGHTYQVEIWDNTGNSGRTDTFSDSSGDSVNVSESGNYVIGTFVASNSEETITENGPYPNINLLQVRDLTAMAAVTNYQSSVLADNPLGYWPLDLTDANAANGVATDLSGNGDNGNYYGISPSSNLVPGPSPYITNAASFNSAEVDLGDPTLLDFGGPITMEAWVQPASTTVGGGSTAADILAKGPDGTYNNDELTLRADGGYYYGGRYDYSDNGANAYGGQQTTNWTYVVSTYDGTNWNLYVNGQLVGRGADSIGALEWPDYWAIGNGTEDGDGRLFQGNICQVALYNYGLTPAQVLTHYYEGELNASPTNSQPIIVSQPQPETGFIGGSVTFSVGVVSALSMTNQWFEGSTLLNGQTNSTLTLTNLPFGANGNNYRVVVGNANGTTNSIAATLTVVSPITLQWSANGNNGTWDVNTSTSWINLSNDTQTVFNQGDAVLFDDTVGVPTTVMVSGTVQPSLITVNSSTNNFGFSSGTISGAGSLVKEGSSVLTITNPVNITGSVTISGGAIYAGDLSLESASSMTITNNATLDLGGGSFNNNTPFTVSGGGLNGEGAIYNSYDDYPAEGLNLTLDGDTKFGGSARWDLASGSQISGPHNLTIDMSADYNDGYYSQWNTLTVGANLSGVIVTNGSGISTNESNLGMSYMDTSCQNPGTLFTVATNCEMIFYNGGFNGSIHVLNGGTVKIPSANVAFNGSSLIFENGSLWETYYNAGTNPVNSAVTLNGVAHFVLGNHEEVYTNLISGSGGFVLDYYDDDMVLAASNTYSGPTIIGSSGNSPEVALTGNGSISHSSLIFFGGSDPTVAHIDVSGRSDQTLTLANGQTLEGVGGINGNLIVSSGATLSPGGTNTTIGITTGSNPIGTIAVSDYVTLDGMTTIKLDGTSNDVVEAGANITYGGTLNLTNISGSPLAAGNSFQIFSAANYLGAFSSITPTTPGAGLAWNTNQLSSGIVSVMASSGRPVIGSTRETAGQLIFSGTGGLANGTYNVLTSTNLLTPLANWTPIATNFYGASGNFSVTNAITPGVPHMFYIIKQQP